VTDMSNTPGELSSIVEDLWLEIIISDEHRLLLQTTWVTKSLQDKVGSVQITSTCGPLTSKTKRVLVSAVDLTKVNVDVSKKRHTSR
jgi:hypothetical protein